MFLKTSQNEQEKTLIKNETPIEVFSFELFKKILKHVFERPQAIAFGRVVDFISHGPNSYC